MRRRVYTLTAAIFVALAGCVVIPNTFDANINVTIRHIQEQADQFLDYVEGKTEELPEFEAPANEQSSLLERAWNALDPVQTAYAAEIKDSSPRVTQIAQSMKERFPQVESIKATGAVGENNRGFLELVKPELIEDAEKRNEVQRVIAAENQDRKALYQEIARLNRDQNLNVSTVERIYAQKRLERAESGELFQLPPAGEDFEVFSNSPTGKKLGDKLVPNAWVRIP